MVSEIGKLRARKNFLYLSLGLCSKISKRTCLDIRTRVFGYLITRVWICCLPGIKGHPFNPNKATQFVKHLMHY